MSFFIISAHKKVFPWLDTFIDEYDELVSDVNQDLLKLLLENISNEVKAVSEKNDNKRLEILFKIIQDLFLHFWWNFRWRGEDGWRESLKKDFTDDFMNKFMTKLLYFKIHIGITLSNGATKSHWIKCIVALTSAVMFFSTCDILVSSLLLVEDLKPKYNCSYCEILKNVLERKKCTHISEPIVYIKIMMLFRRLKENLKNSREKKELFSLAKKYIAPSNLIPWMASRDLDVSQLEHKNVAMQLLKISSKDLFQNFQLVVAENKVVPDENQSDERRNSGLKPLVDIDSNYNDFHLSGDFEVENSRILKNKRKRKKPTFDNEEDKTINSKFEEKKIIKNRRKKNKEELKRNSDCKLKIGKCETRLNLNEVHVLTSSNEKDHNETQSFGVEKMGSVRNTKRKYKKKRKKKSKSRVENEESGIPLNSAEVLTLNNEDRNKSQCFEVFEKESVGNLEKDHVVIKRKKRKKKKNRKKKSNMLVSAHYLISDSGNNESADLYVTPSLTTVDKQSSLLFNPASQLNTCDQMPLSRKNNNADVGKRVKGKTSFKKGTTSKTVCKNIPIKSLNADAFESSKKSIQVQFNKELICNGSNSSHSTHLSNIRNVNLAHSLPLSEKTSLVGAKAVCNRLLSSNVFEKSSQKTRDNVVTKDKKESHVEDEVLPHSHFILPDERISFFNNSSHVPPSLDHPLTRNSSVGTVLHKDTLGESPIEANIVYG